MATRQDGGEVKGLLSNSTDVSGDKKEEADSKATGSTSGDVSSPVDDVQKKIRRAERFGVSVKLTEEEKRNSRAERFGTVVVAVSGSEGAKKAEELKRKARADRFGVPASSSTTKVDNSEEEAKKKARLARFRKDTKVDLAGAPYGNPGVPGAGFGSGPRSSWGGQAPSGYGNVGYGNVAAAPWGGSGPGSAVMGQGGGASAGYGSSQGYGYGGNDASYGAPSGYGAVGGRPGSMPNSHGGGYADASDGSGGYGNHQGKMGKLVMVEVMEMVGKLNNSDWRNKDCCNGGFFLKPNYL